LNAHKELPKRPLKPEMNTELPYLVKMLKGEKDITE